MIVAVDWNSLGEISSLGSVVGLKWIGLNWNGSFIRWWKWICNPLVGTAGLVVVLTVMIIDID